MPTNATMRLLAGIAWLEISMETKIYAKIKNELRAVITQTSFTTLGDVLAEGNCPWCSAAGVTARSKRAVEQAMPWLDSIAKGATLVATVCG